MSESGIDREMRMIKLLEETVSLLKEVSDEIHLLKMTVRESISPTAKGKKK